MLSAMLLEDGVKVRRNFSIYDRRPRARLGDDANLHARRKNYQDDEITIKTMKVQTSSGRWVGFESNNFRKCTIFICVRLYVCCDER